MTLKITQAAREAAADWYHTELDNGKFAFEVRTGERDGDTLLQAFQRAMNQAADEALERAAGVADPPLMHRKRRVGLWRQRRAAIATAIRALKGQQP